ncbi:hypothetical protein A2U01_0058266, partial [Trifolium medium]|nr:hypothetical protein [Trifolium medium]
ALGQNLEGEAVKASPYHQETRVESPWKTAVEDKEELKQRKRKSEKRKKEPVYLNECKVTALARKKTSKAKEIQG